MTDFRVDPERLSSYLQYLPAVYQDDPQSRRFLGRFLLAFEHVMSGLGNGDQPGLEEILDGVTDETGKVIRDGLWRYFEPNPATDLKLADEFLEWLGGWVALGWFVNPNFTADENQRLNRSLLANAVRLYAIRGTKSGLAEMLFLYTGSGAVISEPGDAPHSFSVVINSSVQKSATLEKVARAVIEMGKPAHTFFTLTIEVPEMQIGVRSTIGVDTVIHRS